MACVLGSRRDRAHAEETARRSIAFYASTAAYGPVLDAHGLGELQPRMTEMSRAGRWPEMAATVQSALAESVLRHRDDLAVLDTQPGGRRLT